MSARIINLAEMRQLRSRPESEVTVLQHTTASSERFHFWCGASGQRYVHTIYSLLECPALPASNFILVKRDTSGRRTVLSIGRVTNDTPSLNLAEIRQRGAELGANEVHIHLLACTAKQSKLVEFDLRTGQVRSAEQGSRSLH